MLASELLFLFSRHQISAAFRGTCFYCLKLGKTFLLHSFFELLSLFFGVFFIFFFVDHCRGSLLAAWQVASRKPEGILNLQLGKCSLQSSFLFWCGLNVCFSVARLVFWALIYRQREGEREREIAPRNARGYSNFHTHLSCHRCAHASEILCLSGPLVSHN